MSEDHEDYVFIITWMSGGAPVSELVRDEDSVVERLCNEHGHTRRLARELAEEALDTPGEPISRTDIWVAHVRVRP